VSEELSKLDKMLGSGRTPRACKLAFSRREDLLRRFDDTVRRLTEANRRPVLRSFRAVLSNGKVAINMSTLKLRRFLSEGKWLNIYESAEREGKKIGLKGREIDRVVKRRLQGYAGPRRKIDTLLRFRRDTHYSYLNLGGPGPKGYGFFTVILDVDVSTQFCTCFAGDSILSNFVLRGSRARSIPNEEIIQNFALGADWIALATVEYEKYLSDQRFCVNARSVRHLFESDDSFFEFHLHGSIKRSCISEVRISQESYEPLQAELLKGDYVLHPDVERFKKVRLFQEVVQLLDKHEIPLIIGG
jgi:hypothetical protein